MVEGLFSPLAFDGNPSLDFFSSPSEGSEPSFILTDVESGDFIDLDFGTETYVASPAVTRKFPTSFPFEIPSNPPDRAQLLSQLYPTSNLQIPVADLHGQFLGEGNVECVIKVKQTGKRKRVVIPEGLHDAMQHGERWADPQLVAAVEAVPPTPYTPSSTGGKALSASWQHLRREHEERHAKATEPDQNYDGPKCQYPLCPAPTHSSGTWKTVTRETSAGGRDWSSMVGQTFCHACWTQYRTKGTLLRKHRPVYPLMPTHQTKRFRTPHGFKNPLKLGIKNIGDPMDSPFVSDTFSPTPFSPVTLANVA
eukprot:CAMPEP_0117069952 /NCGR_PEP_ID=MMETSP0472-20121206/49093_1 /TAXON_ID=693140 ORGANISM="Tiarina fusus, Strain LIS" /NCGR_SAMPLE_ID=MMETSP0472 /ASSEMBLY_ACC=CAM_ASM_000603 /LENGTH=308 /DNA_ID=CAMNT_0004792757 /DNA_START=8 /DNA_END=935 /DNA_ORIENTATION=+